MILGYIFMAVVLLAPTIGMWAMFGYINDKDRRARKLAERFATFKPRLVQREHHSVDGSLARLRVRLA